MGWSCAHVMNESAGSSQEKPGSSAGHDGTGSDEVDGSKDMVNPQPTAGESRWDDKTKKPGKKMTAREKRQQQENSCAKKIGGKKS
jgi:hypothetical protein